MFKQSTSGAVVDASAEKEGDGEASATSSYAMSDEGMNDKGRADRALFRGAKDIPPIGPPTLASA